MEKLSHNPHTRYVYLSCVSAAVQLTFQVCEMPYVGDQADHVAIVAEGHPYLLTTPVVPAARNVVAAVIGPLAMTVVDEGVLAVAIAVVLVVFGEILDLVANVVEANFVHLRTPVVPAARNVLAAVCGPVAMTDVDGEGLAVVLVLVVAVGKIVVVDVGGTDPVVGIVAAVDHRAMV